MKCDVAYCSVDKEKIEASSPVVDIENLKIFAHMVKERYKIRVKKDVLKLPQEEWTDDPIFKQYKFTNVRREHDRESLWLIRNISTNPILSLQQKIYNTILFRLYNKSKTLEIFGAPFLGVVDLSEMLIKVKSHLDKKYVWYTSAFNMGGIKATVGRKYSEHSVMQDEDNMKIRPLIAYNDIVKDSVVFDAIMSCRTQEDVFKYLMTLPGLAKFMAYQIFVDFTYIPEFKFTENEFTISGPGCSRGIHTLFSETGGLTDEELIFWVRNNMERICEENGIEMNFYELFSDLPEELRCWNVMSIENCFCEYSKYHRAYSGTGRPKVKYAQNAIHLDGTSVTDIFS